MTRAASGRDGLQSANVDFHGDLVRNIPGIATSQHLFDDLADTAEDHAIAIAAESAGRIGTSAAAITRPFEYGTVIAYTFDASHWQATRFSDGTAYGVWYGSLDPETTVYETAWHWCRFVADSYAELDRDVETDRRVFDVRCDALLIDLRGREVDAPGLVDRTSYAFAQGVGRTIHAQGLNGVLVRSARWAPGTNAAVFKPERLSNVRDRTFLRYRFNPARDAFVAMRANGRRWLAFAPSSLG